MRPFKEGESLQTIVQTAIPDFVESDYPLFVQYIAAFARFLESKRTFANTSISPEFGAVTNGIVQTTVTEGGPAYEARKLLEYRDVATTLDEFTSHFLGMFAKNFPRHTHISADMLVASLRDFYRGKGTVESVAWFFRALFDEDADVYFPREDVLRASDGTWDAPVTIKVTAPITNPLTGVIAPNTDVPRFYIGQRVETDTGSAQVENVTTTIVGQSFNQNLLVNELTLKQDTILGVFLPGQSLHNVDSDVAVYTRVFAVIGDVIVSSGGSNYEPGDIVTFSEGPTGGGGFGATGVVAAVAGTALNGVNVLDGGDGYVTGLPVTFTSTSGSGAEATISEVVFGEFLLEDDTGYFVLEDDGSGSGRFTLEDKNTLVLELLIDPFTNASATVTADSADYGAATGVTQLNGVVLDTTTETALAAVNEKPFMHPWVFTNALHTTAELANASAVLTLTSNAAPFANALFVFALSTPQDKTTNSTNATIKANVIVSDTTVNAGENTLYLKTFTGLDLFDAGLTLKQAGNGVTQQGTVTTDGSATVTGSNTKFSVLSPNTHLRFADGSQHVIRSVANNTVLTTFVPTGVTLAANTWSVVPVGVVTQVTPQAQRFYGKIKTITLTNAGENYKTPPFVSANSMSADVQTLFYYDPDTLSVLPAGGQIHVYRLATLVASQDAGQVTKVKILNGGVNYLDANSVIITAIHGDSRTGKDATFAPVFGAITSYPGRYITSRGWLSADKFLQDGDFFNDFTYVVRVAESFDRYKDILLKLIHPAGFKALGEFVETQEALTMTPGANSSNWLTELYPTHVIGDGAVGYWRLDEPSSYAQAVLSDVPSGYWRLGESPAGYGQAIQSYKPVAYWRLNESSGTVLSDSGTNVINGVLGNTVVFSQTGALSDGTTALQFDGLSGANSHYAYVPFDSRLAPTTGLTLCGWAHQTDWAAFSALTGGNIQRMLASKTESGGYRISFNDNNVGGVVAGYVNRTGVGYAVASWNGQATLTSGWHFFALTFDGRWTRLYVDGAEVANVDNGSTVTIFYNVSNPLVIGGEASVAANATSLGIDSAIPSYPGKLDEIAVFNKELGATALAGLYALRTSTFANTNLLNAADYTRSGQTGNYISVITAPLAFGRTGALGTGTPNKAIKGGVVSLASNTVGPTSNATMTVEFWHKGVDAVKQFTPSGPARRDSVAVLGWEIDKRTPGNTPTGNNGILGVRIDTSAQNNQVIMTNNAVWLWDNNWHHCVLTLNTGVATWFVDGVQSSNAAYNHGNGFYAGNAVFSVYDSGGNDSEADEVAVYPYVLSLAQIQNHYNLRATAQTSPNYSSLILSQSPIAYYKLDEVSGTVAFDATGRGHNGTYSNVTLQQAGALSEGWDTSLAAKFVATTNSCVTIPDSPDWALNALTITCWVKANSWSTTSLSGVVTKDTNGATVPNAPFSLYFNASTDAGATATPVFAICNTANVVPAITGAAIAKGALTHLAGTWDGTTMLLYVNGIIVSTPQTTANMAVTANSLFIGQQKAAFNRFFDGMIDEVAIYNRALTQDDIVRQVATSSGRLLVGATKGVSGAANAGVSALTAGPLSDGTFGMTFDDTSNAAIDLTQATYTFTDVSIELWVKFAPQANTGGFHYFFRTSTSIEFGAFSTGAAAIFKDNGAVGTPSVATGAINDNAWHHLVGVLRGTTMEVWLDGVLAQSGAYPGRTHTNATLSIGGFPGHSNTVKGSVDEVALYPFALSGAQIAKHYAMRLRTLSGLLV
jgi:hypothetical protein